MKDWGQMIKKYLYETARLSTGLKQRRKHFDNFVLIKPLLFSWPLMKTFSMHVWFSLWSLYTQWLCYIFDGSAFLWRKNLKSCECYLTGHIEFPVTSWLRWNLRSEFGSPSLDQMNVEFWWNEWNIWKIQHILFYRIPYSRLDVLVCVSVIHVSLLH